MQRLLLGLFALATYGQLARAEPTLVRAEPPTQAPAVDRPTLVEWTTWLRGSVALIQGAVEAPTAARSVAAVATRERDRTVAGAIGAGFTLPLGNRARVGVFAELHGWEAPVLGGELTFIPGDLDLFFYKGKSAVTLRAGASPTVLTAQFGLAYRAPWDLFTSRPRSNRYMIGVGVYVNATQSRIDPHDWSSTLGIEFEPLGAIRYLLGIRSWY